MSQTRPRRRQNAASPAAVAVWAVATAVVVAFSALVAPQLYHATGWWVFGDLFEMIAKASGATRAGITHLSSSRGGPGGAPGLRGAAHAGSASGLHGLGEWGYIGAVGAALLVLGAMGAPRRRSIGLASAQSTTVSPVTVSHQGHSPMWW